MERGKDVPYSQKTVDVQGCDPTPWPDFANAPTNIVCGDDGKVKPVSGSVMDASEQLARQYFDKGIRI